MTQALITITVDRAEVDAVLSRLVAFGEDTSKPMAVVSRVMEENVRNTFRDETDPWGNHWPPHAPSTVKARQRNGNTRTSLLIDRGDMYDSIKRESDANSATVSMDGPAEVHQFGTTTAGRGHSVTIPARAMFPNDDDVPDAWLDSVSAPLLAAMNEAVA
jgi:phage virion morphogenesis protein